jgi:hypothetical protein
MLVHNRETARSLSDYQFPADLRIQKFLDEYLHETQKTPSLLSQTLILHRHGLARALSLLADGDEFVSDIVSSYRVRQGVLYYPPKDRKSGLCIRFPACRETVAFRSSFWKYLRVWSFECAVNGSENERSLLDYKSLSSGLSKIAVLKKLANMLLLDLRIDRFRGEGLAFGDGLVHCETCVFAGCRLLRRRDDSLAVSLAARVFAGCARRVFSAGGRVFATELGDVFAGHLDQGVPG